MILNLGANELLRLTGARGTTVEVLDGSIWITEAGRAGDALVDPGMRYDVAGDGLVVIGADAGCQPAPARIAVAPALWRWLWRRAVQAGAGMVARIRERRTLAELEALPERTLRDIGLTREDLRWIAHRR